jgi:hypothetical protein
MKNLSILSLMIIFVLSGLTVFAKTEIVATDRTENSAVINFVSDEVLRYLVVLRKDSAKPVKPISTTQYKSIKKKISFLALEKLDIANAILYDGIGNFSGTLEGLEPNTHYTMELYTGTTNSVYSELKTETQIFHFSTFAAEPQKQAGSIAFRGTTEHQIEALWANGDGKGRIVVVKKDKKPELPKDGVEYKAGKFGNPSCQIPNTESYVVYNSSQMTGGRIKVDSLDYGKYFFQIFEYNGSGETINYNTNSSVNNPRYKATLIPPPTALPATNITADAFTANWVKYPNVKHYELDVAKDAEFLYYIDTFQNNDIGDITSIEIKDLENDVYYYRIKAYVDIGISEYSNVIKVEMKK